MVPSSIVNMHLAVLTSLAERFAVDKGVANRFIKHAISQVQFGRPPGQDEGVSEEANDVRVPVKVTSKMLARAEYEKELKDLGSEEEDDLEMIDDVAESEVPEGKSRYQSTKLFAALQMFFLEMMRSRESHLHE